MNISVRWLQRHVDLGDLTPEQIANDLTLSTAETEGITRFGDGLEQLVIGHVIEHGRHPDADKLSVNKVDLGGGVVNQIVCGASNVGLGQKVCVIQPGAKLPDVGPKAGIKIKKAKIRGVESLGMICSEAELGLSEDHDGIMVLPEELEPGTRFVDAFPVQDHVIEIDNKSINHRPDLWGHRGIARELAAMHGLKLAPLGKPIAFPQGGDRVEVDIEDLAGCPRYLGLCLEGVEAGRSPDWLRYLLLAVGQRPIDLLVDLTNFVMLDLGQPMHAFDRRQVGARVGVRRAKAGESMTTLDGQERALVDSDLLITTGEKGADTAVALAGVMGGEGSMVEPGTSALFLESANFHAATVRRTSVRLGLRTDASARFEKAQDPTAAADAVHHFVRLLQQECPGAAPAGPLVEAAAEPQGWRYEPKTVPLRRSRLDLKLGLHVPNERVGRFLSALGFGVKGTDDGFAITVPSWRATKDISIEDDLIEEVGRMYRYDNIPEQPLRSVVRVPRQDPGMALGRRLLTIGATEMGCAEVYHYSFHGDDLLAAVGADELPHSVVRNPVAPELRRIRRRVLPSLLPAVAANLRTRAAVRLMERGKGYLPEEGGPQGPDRTKLPREVHELAFAWVDQAHPYGLLRSHVERMLERVGRPAEITELMDPTGLPWIHPGKTVALGVRGAGDGAASVVGYVGSVHPRVADALGLPLTTAIASLDIGALVAVGERAPAFAPIPRFPGQPVDVALLASEGVRVGDVADFLRGCGKKLVREVTLFEVYRGEGVGDGQKSLNFTVTLGAPDRTLSAKDEEKFLARVRKDCGQHDLELRG